MTNWYLWTAQAIFDVALAVYVVNQLTSPPWKGVDPMALPGYLNRKRRVWLTGAKAAAKAWQEATTNVAN